MVALAVNMSRLLLKNAVSQIAGRLLLSLGRLVAALLIVRNLGAAQFGAYALVVWFVGLFEWLADFGQTDIAVRDICQQPEREAVILRALAGLKALQGLSLFLLLPGVLYMLDYPWEIVRAALIGGIGLPFYAAVQVFRTRLKVVMRMERDVLAELGGLLVMLPLTWYACIRGAGVEVLVACYMASRVTFLFLVILLGRFSLPADGRLRAAEALALLRQAAPLGMAGLLVSLYDGLALLVLSKMADLSAVAQYVAATRYVFPVIIVVQSLNSAFYAPLSASWKRSPAQFAQLQQTVLESSILVGGAIFCGVYASAGFLMSLIGSSIGEAAGLLRLLSWVVLARTVTTAMSPLIVIGGAQNKVLWITICAILLQVVALLELVPGHGATGAAIGYLTIEIALGVIPVSVIGQQVTGVRLHWSAPVKLLVAAAIVILLCGLLPFAGTLASGALAVALYLAFAVVSGAVSPRKLRRIIAGLISPPSPASAPIVPSSSP
jgi:O-antigen/teichoic acid export membrane protein